MSTTISNRLERLQRRAAHIILGINLYVPVNHFNLLSQLEWPTLLSRRQLQLAILGWQLYHHQAPLHLRNIAFEQRTVPYSIRRAAQFHTPIAHTCAYMSSPVFRSCTVFDSLPSDMKMLSLPKFKQAAAEYLLTSICHCSSFPYPH